MTIKQLGGVFGRNPTFNDVTIEGTLTTEDMTSTGIDVVGPELVTNGTFDTDTDWTKDTGWSIGSGVLSKASGSGNGRAAYQAVSFVAGTKYLVTFDYTDLGSDIGFGYGTIGSYAGIRQNLNPLSGTGTKTYTITPSFNGGFIGFYGNDSNVGEIDNLSVKQIALIANLDDGVIVGDLQVGGALSGDPLQFNIGNSEAARIDAGSNLLVGTTATPTSSAGNIVLANGTAPTASATDGVILYAEDVSSSSELKVRDEAGNITTLSPHNFDLIPQGPSEDMAWSYYSERDGKRINVDMLKAIRVLEKLSGEQLVFEN